MAAYLVPVSLLYHAYIHWQELADHRENSRALKILRLVGWVLMLLALSGLFNLVLDPNAWIYPEGPGGFLGKFAPYILLPMLNLTGSILLLCAIFLVGITLFSGKAWLKHFWSVICVLGRLGKKLLSLFHWHRAPKEAAKAEEKIIIEDEPPPFAPDEPVVVVPKKNRRA